VRNRCSVLNSPHGWLTLHHAYTLYAESAKANDPTKRGRFNEGEKNVLCLAIEASITTVTGQVCFDRERGRWNGSEHRKRGSEFYMKFELTPKEYADICGKTRLLIPPKDIITTFNGVEIAHRAPDLRFDTRLRTPRDSRNEPRKTEVRLYSVLHGEKPMIYESSCGIVCCGGGKVDSVTQVLIAAEGKHEDDDLDRRRVAAEIVEVILTTPADWAPAFCKVIRTNHDTGIPVKTLSFPCEPCDGPNSIVVKSTNKVRFHIGASPRREERVEHALQLDILHDGQAIGKWLPEFSQWLYDLLSVRGVSAVASGYRKKRGYYLAMQKNRIGLPIRRGWSQKIFAKTEEPRVRWTPDRKHLPENTSPEHGSSLKQTVLERRDDSEIAAAATQTPKQILVFVDVCRQEMLC
jgi:hypothetical protein